MRLFLLFTVCCLLLAFPKLIAQNPDELGNSTQFLIENIVADGDAENFDFDTQFEYLEDYLKNPLDINNATEQDLVDMGLLSSIQIQALLLYRAKFGQLFTLYELQGVPTFELNDVLKLSPYIKVSPEKELPRLNFKNMLRWSRHQIFARYQRILETQKGFTPLEPGETGTRFLGSPDKYYLRYKMSYKDRMSFGLTMEKDAGEEFFTGSNPQGFDFYSAHFFLKKVNKYIECIALGDFQVFFGQGLTIWGGFGIRKGAQVLNIKRLSQSIRPYSSVNEALFNRGAAAQFKFLKNKQLEWTIFGSYRNRDANIQSQIDTLIESADFEISTLQEIGYHRTEAEIQDENAIGMISSGTRLNYKGSFWHIASNFVYNHLTNPLIRTRPSLYQQFQFSGDHSYNFSLDYSIRYKEFVFFGETAVNNAGGLASLNALTAAVDPRVDLVLLHRYYDKKYYTLTGNAFAESSDPSNEHGLYLGMENRLGKGFRLSNYFDVFYFPWLKFQVDAPSFGYEFFTKLDYRPSYYLKTYLQYRYEQKAVNLSGNTTNLDQLIQRGRHNLRFHLDYDVNAQVSIRSRVEFSFFQTDVFKQGFMIYQDLVFKAEKIPLKAHFRLAFFDTDSYDTRIYAYENDVLYAFSVLPYFGQGLRYYLNLNYRINDHISLWLRFSQTYFTDREVISSGLNEIEGNTRSEIKAQVRFKF